MTTIRDIEKSIDLGVEPGAACDVPNYDPNAGDPFQVNNYPIVGAQMSKLAAMALACEQAPVALFQWSTGQCSTRHSWVSNEAGSSGYHGFTHQGDAGQQVHDDVLGCYAEQVARFLDDLDALPEGDGTVLDNTIVLWIGGEQASSTNHNFDDMPYVLFGGGGGVLQTGQHLQFDGRSANDLMVTLQHAMGMDDDSFGEQEFVQGVLPGNLA